jgi:hypothetical protein
MGLLDLRVVRPGVYVDCPDGLTLGQVIREKLFHIRFEVVRLLRPPRKTPDRLYALMELPTLPLPALTDEPARRQYLRDRIESGMGITLLREDELPPGTLRGFVRSKESGDPLFGPGRLDCGTVYRQSHLLGYIVIETVHGFVAVLLDPDLASSIRLDRTALVWSWRRGDVL